MQVSFGRFVFDSEARELRRDGEPLHLSPKAFLLLEALLQSRPKALSKSDLHDHVWPNTFVVEANLANLVAEIRAALGDDPRRPRFVRTVHGYGYAFREGTGRGASSPQPPGTRPAAALDALPAHRLVWGRQVIPLAFGASVIGRAGDVSVRIDAPGVSRRHARILIGPGEATLEDLGSKNGTYLRERRLEGPAALVDGDAFRVGGQVLVYQCTPLEDPTLTEPGG